MNAHRLLYALTGMNAILLLYQIGSGIPAAAADPGIVPVLRGHALEIVDARGQVRASITVLPGDPTVKMPNGKSGYPESVLLRLRSSAGHPNVKLSATEDGAGLVLGGDSEATFVQLLARGDTTFAKLSNHDGRVHTVQP